MSHVVLITVAMSLHSVCGDLVIISACPTLYWSLWQCHFTVFVEILSLPRHVPRCIDHCGNVTSQCLLIMSQYSLLTWTLYFMFDSCSKGSFGHALITTDGNLTSLFEDLVITHDMSHVVLITVVMSLHSVYLSHNILFSPGHCISCLIPVVKVLWSPQMVILTSLFQGMMTGRWTLLILMTVWTWLLSLFNNARHLTQAQIFSSVGLIMDMVAQNGWQNIVSL